MLNFIWRSTMFEFNIDKIESQGKKIYETAIALQVKYGMLVQDDFCRERILQHKGTRVEGERVFYSEELVREMIPFGSKDKGLFCDITEDSFHYRGNQEGNDGYRFRAGGFAMSVYDVEKGTARASTAKDLEEALMLCDVLNIGGHYPCTATDCDPRLRNIAAHFMCLTKSRVSCTHVCAGIEQADIIHRMHQVLGPEAQMPITMTIVTPFRIEETNLQVIRHFIEKGVAPKSLRIVPVGYGLSGMNYPITTGGSWALCLAEHMGLKITATLIKSGFDIAKAVGPVGLGPVDFQNMCLALGNPSQNFCHFANNILVHAALGRNWREYPHAEQGLWTGSPFPDTQAASEKLSTAIMGHLMGCKMYGRLGNLCVDDVFSCEQLLLDIELVKYAREMIGQFGKADAFMDMEGLMEEVGDYVENDVSFMMAGSTMKYLRELFPEPGIFVHKKLAAIKETGSDSLLKQLSERKRELLKQYNFALPGEQQKELENIYEDAKRILIK